MRSVRNDKSDDVSMPSRYLRTLTLSWDESPRYQSPRPTLST